MVLAKQTYRLKAKSLDNSSEWEERFDELKKDAEESLKRAEEGYKKATENSEQLLKEHMAIERLDTNIGEIKTDIGNINTNIGDINTNIGEVGDKVDSVNADLSNVKTNVGQINTDIGHINTDLSITKDKYNTITSRLDSIEANSNGNKNLFFDADNMTNPKYWTIKGGSGKAEIVDGTAYVKQQWGGPAYFAIQLNADYPDLLKIGDECTFSIDVMVDRGVSLPYDAKLMFYADSLFENDKFIVNFSDLERGKWKRVSVVTKYVGNAHVTGYIRAESTATPGNGVIKLRKPKLEKGSKPTDYDSIGVNFSEIYQQIDAIKTTVGNNTGKITEVTQKADGIQSTVRDNTGKITQLTQTIDGLNSKIENVGKSNPNLLKSTDNMLNTEYWTPKGSAVMHTDYVDITQAWTGPAYYLAKLEGIQPNTDYTISFDVKIANDATWDGNAQWVFYTDGIFNTSVVVDNFSNIAKGKWSRIHAVIHSGSDVTATRGIMRIEGNKAMKTGRFQIRRFKLEEGTEMTTEVGIFSEIKQTIEGIQTTVGNQQGQISQNTQTINGFDQRIKDVEGNMSSVTQTVEGIHSQVQDNKNNITDVVQTSQALTNRVQDAENNISKVTQTSQAIKQEISDVKGNINTITSTVNGTTQRIENVEGQVSDFTHTVEGIKNEVKDQNGKLSSMEHNIDGFQSRVEAMVGDVTGANLIGNKDPMIEMTATPSNVKSENHEGYAKFSSDLKEQQVAPSAPIELKIEKGTKVTQQIEIHTDGNLTAVTFEKGGTATLISKEKKTWVAHVSFETEGESTEVLKITSITVENATYVEFRRPKVEKGDYTDYKLSTTEFDKVTSEIKQTAQGIQTTIESQNGKISQMTQTVDGMLSKVSEGEQKFSEIKQTVNGIQQTVQDNTGKIAQTTTTVDGILNKVSEGEEKFTEIKQTVNGIQNTVRDQSGKISQMTQTVDGVLSKVESLEGGNPNLLKSDRDMTDSTYWTKKGNSGITIYPDYAEITSAWSGPAYKIEKLLDIKANSDYTLSFDVKLSSDSSYADNAQLVFYSESLFDASVVVKKMNEITKGDWVRLWFNLRSSSTSGTGIMRVECNSNATKGNYQIRRFKLEEGKVMTTGNKQFSELKQTIEGVQATVQNQEGKINQLTVRADGMLSEIRDNAGNISSFQHKIDSLQTKVTDNTGKWTQLSQTVNGISSIATDAKNQASYVAQKADSIQSKVMNLQNKTESAISQLEDQVNLRVRKGDIVNQINVDYSGVRIDGRKVEITGDTYIERASIDAASIKNLDADKIIANKASFIQKGLNEGTGSKVEITAKGIKFSGRPYTSDYDNNYVEVNSGHLKFWAGGGGVYGDSYGYIGTAKRGRFLTLTAGVVKNSSADRSPAFALRSSGQDVLVATRQSVALSGGTVYIGNNTAQDDSYYDFYNNVYEATKDGQITSSTTDRVAIGANNEVWLRCKRSVKVNAGNDFIVDTSSSVFLRPSGDVKMVPGSGVNIQRYTSYDGNKDLRFYYESQFGFGINAPGVYKRTSSGSANLTITGNYNIMKTSSARKYKTAIQEIDNLEEAKKMLEISPISWIDKAEAREKGMKNCDRYVGFLADDFDDAGLTEVVDYDQNGEVESLAYDRLSVYMIQLIKDLYKKVEALEK